MSGYFLSALSGSDERERRTVAIEIACALDSRPTLEESVRIWQLDSNWDGFAVTRLAGESTAGMVSVQISEDPMWAFHAVRCANASGFSRRPGMSLVAWDGLDTPGGPPTYQS